MSIKDDVDMGIRILSLDTGGPGTYSQLLIIKEYMTRMANDLGIDECDLYPADYFELMGGVGFGGLVAIMLGYLRMNVDDAIEALLSVASAVFPQEAYEEADRETNMKRLQQSIENLLQARGVPIETQMHDKRQPPAKCKVAIYAATSANLNHPTVFRTYASRGTSLNPTIVESVCATMAVPSLFTPMKIGPHLREQSFVGGPVGANNPTRELLKEAASIFGKDRRVAQILSIGSGRTRLMAIDQSATADAVSRLVRDMASDCGIVARELSTRLHSVQAYLRLNVDRGMENVKIYDWNCLGDIESHTNAYVEITAITEAVETSMRHLQDRIGSATLGQINHSSSIKVMAKTVPTVSPFYVVLNKAVDIMMQHLVKSNSSSQKIFPITGMGGCGKTQLVSYFMRENRSLYTHVAFVDASSLSSIKTDLQVWAQSLGDGHEQDTWEDAIKFLASGPHDGRWVLVLDNADDPKINLVSFFPKCYNGTILITSRNRRLGNLASTYHLELGQMETEEAFATLIQAARRQLSLPPAELEDAHILMEELGRLAAALVHAGTYCRQLSTGVLQPYTFTQYLSLFYMERAALLNKPGPSSLDGYQHGIYTTLDLSYRAIPSSARDFLHLVSHFHHTDIQLSMFAIAAQESFEDPETLLPRPKEHLSVISDLNKLLCTFGMWSELHVEEIIETLRSFSLVSTTIIEDSLYIQLHPLVRAWSKDMPLPNRKDYRNMAGQIITSCSQRWNLQNYRYLVPHINVMLQGIKIRSMHVNDLMAVGEVLREQGHYNDAEVLFSEALRALRNVFEKETEETLLVAGRLAQVFSNQGRYVEAKKLQLQILDQRRQLFGMEHTSTITATSNLATTYWHQGRWETAASLGLEVLEWQRKTLGREHLDTILATVNLATTYSNSGRWSEAEKLGLEALALRRQILGAEHHDTIKAAAYLAINYSNQGRWYEAEALELEVLEQQQRLLGPDHLDTVRASENLGSSYRRQGRYADAEVLDAEVLEHRQKILGMEHPDTIRAVANLASSYYEQGRLKEAELLDIQVLEQQRRVLGPNHPDTITAAANLASTYHDQGRYDLAEKINLEVIADRKRVLGPDHPDTTLVAANLATTYHHMGRLEEAEKLQIETIVAKRRTLGNDHPDTILVVANLAFTYMVQGRWEEALTTLAPAIPLSIKMMKQHNPDTQENIRRMVTIYEALGRDDQAHEMGKLLVS